MVTIEVKKELVAKVKLPELEVEARIIISAKGEVELNFMPWSQWNLSGDSFEHLVEDFNLLKAHIRLCVENQNQEQLKSPPKR